MQQNLICYFRVILVEGIAEQLLLYIFAQYNGISLEEKHVSVVNVGEDILTISYIYLIVETLLR